MWPGGADADQHVAWADVWARQHGVTLQYADDGSGDVEFARLVDARHFSGFATQQGAT